MVTSLNFQLEFFAAGVRKVVRKSDGEWVNGFFKVGPRGRLHERVSYHWKHVDVHNAGRDEGLD